MKLIPNLAEIDRKAFLQAALSATTLMEAAGEQVAKVVQSHCQPAQQGVIVCGPGNNGGDGFVCARKLYQAGFLKLIVIHTTKQYKNEALANFETLFLKLPIQIIDAQEQTALALQSISEADFIVDALFGSGLARPIADLEASLIEAMNQTRPTVWKLAVDLPSGLNSSTGQSWGCMVRANATVTFGASKPGLYLQPGKACAGEITIADIGLPSNLIEEDESCTQLITRQQARDWLPARQPDSHKYSHGHVLVIAGSQKMPGAAVLSSEAAMSAGAGLVTLAAPSSVFAQLPLMPEVIRLPLPDEIHLTPQSVSCWQEAVAQKRLNTLIIGPGLGNEPETLSAIVTLLTQLKETDLPVVIDADGLNALSQSDLVLNDRFILTPNIGECARLLKIESAAILADVLQAAQQVQERYQAQVVLKSASTVIASQAGNAAQPLRWISPVGNPGMATAGSGDVLSGIIGAMAARLHAQKQPVWQAAPLGVYVQGLAGDFAAKALTEYAMRASDITRHLPQAFGTILL